MKNIIISAFFALSLFTTIAVGQNRTTVAGVLYDNTDNVAGTALVLNGAGVRTRSSFKVYAAGLYVTNGKTTAAGVLALAGAKRMKIVMYREVSAVDMGDHFVTGINNNTTENERTNLAPSIVRFTSLFDTVPALKKGDVLTLDWIPGTGLLCALNDKAVGDAIGDSAFFQSVLKIWLGNNPVDSTLKTALLRGGPTGSR
jgi:Chalcone isomerase-like